MLDSGPRDLVHTAVGYTSRERKELDVDRVSRNRHPILDDSKANLDSLFVRCVA